MRLIIDEKSASFEYRLNFADFPDLVQAHLAQVPNTAECEQLGQRVLKSLDSEFEFEVLEEFIRTVCRWGGFAGVGGRVIKNNSPKFITDCFTAARDFMLREKLDVKRALREINRIKGLGTPSFASKHLRFLWPQLCPVLDSNTTRLGYDFTPEGYAKFARDCKTLANALLEREVKNPICERSGEWFVSEIDMALFAHLMGWYELNAPKTT